MNSIVFWPLDRAVDSSDWTGNEDTHQASASGPSPPLNLESHSVQTVTWGQLVLGDSIMGRQPRQHQSEGVLMGLPPSPL